MTRAGMSLPNTLVVMCGYVMMSVQEIPRAAPPLQGDFGICIELFEILT